MIDGICSIDCNTCACTEKGKLQTTMLGGDTGGKGEGEGTGEDFGKQMKREEESIVNRKTANESKKRCFCSPP